jgi:hypothetical protein
VDALAFERRSVSHYLYMAEHGERRCEYESVRRRTRTRSGRTLNCCRLVSCTRMVWLGRHLDPGEWWPCGVRLQAPRQTTCGKIRCEWYALLIGLRAKLGARY